MATVTRKLCDISGTELPEDATGVILSLQNGGDGSDFRIGLDLSDAEKAKLLKVLRPYAEKGRNLGPVIVPAPSKATDPMTARIRAWGIAEGHKVSEKGRVPNTVVEAFYAAHPDERPNT